MATVIRYARSIHAAHRLRDVESPTKSEPVRLVLRGIRRERGTRQSQKAALTAQIVAQILEKSATGNEVRDLRDRVVILLGLATAMRRSELCGIRIEDLHFVEGGLVLELGRSKTDQEGVGRPLAVPRLTKQIEFCAVVAVEKWLEVLGESSGPLIRGFYRNWKIKLSALSEGYVAAIVKRVVAAGGLNPDDFGGHSMRAGFVTTARENGVDWASIMEQTGHKRLETVKLYTRYTPDVFTSTRVVDIFDGAFESGKKK